MSGLWIFDDRSFRAAFAVDKMTEEKNGESTWPIPYWIDVDVYRKAISVYASHRSVYEKTICRGYFPLSRVLVYLKKLN